MEFSTEDYKEIIFEQYNQKIVDFGNGMIELTAYAIPQVKQVGNIKHKGGANEQSEISDEAQENRTKLQSQKIKRKIRGYALVNDFEWFVTLTLDPKKNDSYNFEESKKLLLKWCRYMRDTYGKFDYLIIPEFHKSGAVHFHGLLGDIPANFVEAIHPKSGQPLMRNDRQIYNLTDWKHGFTDCEKIIDSEKTASYLTKYITKELMSNKEMFRKKRYFNSKGLKNPTIEYLDSEIVNLTDFVPNFGIVSTDEEGNNVLEKSIYKLQKDKKTGELFQKDTSYLIKANSSSQESAKTTVTSNLKDSK